MTKYYITISKEEFDEVQGITINDISLNEDAISFYTDKKGYQKLKNFDIQCEIQNKSFNWFRKNLIMIIGCLIIIALLIVQGVSVRKIEFTNYDTYDQEVYDYLYDNLKKVGPFYFLDETLKDVNQHLRSTFYKYEWIGIRKEASVLYVDIKKLDDINNDGDVNNDVGDLIASDDAIVEFSRIENGIVLVERNQTVTKGEVLVSGNLLIKSGGVNYTRAKGIVVGTVMDYQYLEIPKEETKLTSTSRLEYYQKIVFFNQNFDNKSEFENFRTEVEVIFEIPNFLKIIRIYNYELIDVTTTYELDDATRYGKSIIKSRFISNKVDDKEEVISIETIDHQETEDSYIIKYLVKTKKNIALFNKVIV